MTLDPRYKQLKTIPEEEWPEKLRRFLRYKRYIWRQGKLPEEEEDFLLSISISPDKTQDKRPWDHWYQMLWEYQIIEDKEYPSYKGHEKGSEMYKLGRWVNKQRQVYIKLSDKRRKKLEDLPLGFTLDADKRHFVKNFKRAKAFKKKHGHLDIPNKGRYKDLYAYLNMIRYIYNNRNKPKFRNRYSPDQYRMLSAIGMNWDGGFQTRIRKIRKELDEQDFARWQEEWQRHMNEIKMMKG